MFVRAVNFVNKHARKFSMNGDVAVAKNGDVPAEYEDTCRQAAEECPVEAIIITD